MSLVRLSHNTHRSTIIVAKAPHQSCHTLLASSRLVAASACPIRLANSPRTWRAPNYFTGLQKAPSLRGYSQISHTSQNARPPGTFLQKHKLLSPRNNGGSSSLSTEVLSTRHERRGPQKTQVDDFDSSEFNESDSDSTFVGRWQTPKYHMLAEIKAINGDPLKLTQQVRRYLDKGEDNKALELARYAGVNMNAVVSWNFIISSEMEKGRLNLAMKRYTEMKKRAQKPDSYTYMTVLRGCAENSDKKKASSYAISAFNAMFAANSACKPTIMHANACINVCARQGDVDGMFGIASRLPSTGPGAADFVTFTTILNAIRVAAFPRGAQLRDTDTFRAREDAVFQGRRMWRDIVQRWTTGEIGMDEKLVAAMGRLLAIGTRKDDVDDMFSLLEQTMAIPRQTHLPRRQGQGPAQHPSIQGALASGQASDDAPVEDLQITLDQESHLGSNSSPNLSSRSMSEQPSQLNFSRGSASEFAPIANTGYRIQFARPGPNTLSLILEACARLNAFKAAAAYWDMMVKRITPERENYHAYLRLLRMSHSSAASRQMCETMAESVMDDGSKIGVEAKTFKIAMAACSRDILNSNMLESATALARLMLRELKEPELGASEKFLHILEHKDNRQDGRSMDIVFPALQTTFDLAQGVQPLFVMNSKHIHEFRDKEASYQPRFRERTSESFDESSTRPSRLSAARKNILDREAQQGAILGLVEKAISVSQSLRDCHRHRLTSDQYSEISKNIGRLSDWLAANEGNSQMKHSVDTPAS